MSEPIKKPQPRPAPESVAFWQAAREHRLEVPHCKSCGKFWFPPSRSCPHCLSTDVGFEAVSGNGKVFSFVTFHRVYHPAFAGDVPYVVALVELDEGARMLTNIVGIPPEKVTCDMRVRVVFEDEGETSIPRFTPV